MDVVFGVGANPHKNGLLPAWHLKFLSNYFAAARTSHSVQKPRSHVVGMLHANKGWAKMRKSDEINSNVKLDRASCNSTVVKVCETLLYFLRCTATTCYSYNMAAALLLTV